jgi:hypothetical protein
MLNCGGKVAVQATQQIGKMRGGAQSHLMLADDGVPYVVKFQNNPQDLRVLVNEWLGTQLARMIGLPSPPCEIVEVTSWLIENAVELNISVGERVECCLPGLHFGSQFVGGLMPGSSVDYLPEPQLAEVRNLRDFAGMLVFDKWTCNSNGRQAVFHRKQRERKYTATFIDHGFCFGAGEWIFHDAPLRGVFARNLVYAEVKGWESFEPWLSRIREISIDRIWQVAEQIPPEWYRAEVEALEQLVERVYARRERIPEWITAFRESSREPFPNWKGIAAAGAPRIHGRVISVDDSQGRGV